MPIDDRKVLLACIAGSIITHNTFRLLKAYYESTKPQWIPVGTVKHLRVFPIKSCRGQEILYIPCMIGLRRDLKSSCIKIMFCLSFLDMFAIMANCVVFGYLMLEGAVYCSSRAITLGVGIVGYAAWCTASTCCLVLACNRLFEVLGLSKYFTTARINIYIGICCAYGILMTLFTRPVIFNSKLQSMFFSPFIPGHSFDEYVNWPHAVHNIVVTFLFCAIYLTLCIVLSAKSRALYSTGSTQRLIYNMPIFAQAMIISCVNLVAASIYVFMNFIPVPAFVIVLGQAFWQMSHASPPYIYLALNKSIRRFVFESVGLGSFLRNQSEVRMFTTTQGSPVSLQAVSTV